MKRLLLAASFLIATFVLPAAAWAHLLITEVGYDTVNEGSGMSSEYVEIFNPGPGSVSLDDVWIVNDEAANYPNLVNGVLTGVGASDFVYRFPAGTTLLPGDVAVITWNSDTFLTEFFGGSLAAFQAQPGTQYLFEAVQDGAGDGVPDMINGGSNPAFNFSMTNTSECIGIATWDNASDLVQDLDWVCWGSIASIPNKDVAPGSIDGPDADTTATAFADDTGTAQPTIDPAQGNSINRPSPSEPAEVTSGGNGVTGHDETSEDWSGWNALPYSPGVVDLCSAQSTQCATSTLDLGTGNCTLTPAMAGTSCDDANLCTNGDACDGAGACVGTPVVCDDSNICTDDTCNMADGMCTFTDNTSPCDDGNACTDSDQCNAGTCSGTMTVCDDNDACTTDSCDPMVGCQSAPVVCDDNDACTTDSCDPMLGCQTAPVVCDDNDACTTDSCDTMLGCQTAPVVCDDNDACTTDSCDTMTGCQTAVVDCDDGLACTTDTCDPMLGCQNVALMCDDGDACTTDTCDAMLGCQSVPLVCDDNNPCTMDSCDPMSGCQTATISCDDSDPCTIDVCQPLDGSCSHMNTCGGGGGTGGQGGSGGTGGSTGSGGQGGSGTGGSGAVGSSGTGGTGGPADESGCSCKATGNASRGETPATLVALGFVLLGFRSRRRRSTAGKRS